MAEMQGRSSVNPKPATGPVRIALVAADPFSTDPVRMEEEAESIRGNFPESYVQVVHARSDAELTAGLSELLPSIVHFSGYGSSTRRILLELSRSYVRNVTGGTVARLIEHAVGRVTAVILNDCRVHRGITDLQRASQFTLSVESAPPATELGPETAATLYRELAHSSAQLQESETWERGKAAVSAFRAEEGVVSTVALLHGGPESDRKSDVRPASRLGVGAEPQLVKRVAFRVEPTAARWDHDPTEGYGEPRPAPAGEVHRVWFGTNRRPSRNGEFGAELDDRTHFH